MDDLSRFAIHTITTKPWPFETAVEKYAQAGIRGVSVWKESISHLKPKAARALLDAHGLATVSMVRGGFFVSPDPKVREERIRENLDLIRASAELGAPHIVLVCGADPKVPIRAAWDQVRQGLEAILPEAEKAGVGLAIEPLHPMYADARAAVNTLGHANDLCNSIAHPKLGVAVDVYHVWWDPALELEIARCGAMGKIFAFHVCDWRTPTVDFLNDRGLPGEGCIDIPYIRGLVEKAGFSGFVEVEIFSHRLWAMDQDEFLGNIRTAFKEHV